jgi:hypothetical protein
MPTWTRRRKLAYHEVDASLHYMTSDNEADTPARKVPNTPSGSQPPPTADLGLEQDWLDYETDDITRKTKVRAASNQQLLSV